MSILPPPPQAAPLLSIEALQVQFGNLVAVKDLTLELRPGQLLGLIGPNGAGKTTLLRAAAGLIPLTSGQVKLMEDRVEPGAGHVLRHIGFTPDTPAVYEELTVRKFLRFVARGYELSDADIEDRISFWLEKVWLTEKADQKIKGLSRGMRQRIGLARTLIANPALVLLDEPAAGLDPAGRVQFRELLASLRDQGKGLIVSSHILSDMAEYCTHIGIMAKGELLQFGTVDQVAHGDNQRRRYAVELLHPIDLLTRERIEALAGLSELTVDNTRLTFSYSALKEDAAVLLKELVLLDLPVASFAPSARGLEEAYLRTGIAQVD